MQMVMAFIDAHRGELGIEPTCLVPSTYHSTSQGLPTPAGVRPELGRDDAIRHEFARVDEASFGLQGRTG